MERNGLSFTLTLVVVGVVLLMTALTVVTLGGSSLSNFFSFFEDRGEQAATEAQIQEACNTRAAEIQRDYCDKYVATSAVAHEEGTCDDGAQTEPGTDEDCDGDGTPDQPTDDTYPAEDHTTPSATCGSSPQDDRSVPPPSDQERYNDGVGTDYFERTAEAENCDWTQYHSEASPVVTVEGDQYNCLDRGYINPQCPVR